MHLLADVDTLVWAARTAGYEPPLLACGVSERVGSNWLSDTLRRAGMPQHNEPLRQQIDRTHPLSPCNPEVPREQDAGAVTLSPYARHWLRVFVASKYGPVPHLVKETNLFGAWPLLMRLFRDAPVMVLSRSPLGIASSFVRDDLFERWQYPARYQGLVTMTRRPEWKAWAPLVPDDNPAQLQALTRMTVLNALLLASAVVGRRYEHVAYEAAVFDRQLAARTVAALVPSAPRPKPQVEARQGAAVEPAVDDTFATHRGHGLVAYLTDTQAEAVRAETANALATARELAPAGVVGNAAVWLAGDHQYRLAPPRTRGLRSLAPMVSARASLRYVAVPGHPDLHVRNLLVSNSEFCTFMNAMAALVPNTTDGTHLLHVSSMPHERGGRIHFDGDTGRYAPSPGYGQHPVYWVTWIGAAAYAAWQGARLPRREEMDSLAHAAGYAVSNADYRIGDTVPVVELGRRPDEIHHAVGNVQVWCADGPDMGATRPTERWLCGAAWNTPGSREEIDLPRSRHLTGASRGVGVRLVCNHPATGLDDKQLAQRLLTWIDRLRDTPPLGSSEQELLDALRS